MGLGYADKSGPGKIKFWPVYLCFIMFGIMVPFSKEEVTIAALLLSSVLALLVGLLAVNALIMLFNAGNGALRESSASFAQESVKNGMLFMIPFTILAAMAKFILGWDAVMPFASAAIMTATATAGTEVMKKGAQGMKNVLIPSALAFVLSTAWMMLAAILP